MKAATPPASCPPAERFHLPRRAFLALLTAHIVCAVGLLGDSAGFLAVAIRRMGSHDAGFREATHELLAMFALVFGIPLSFLALLTGIALGLSTTWGVFRYPWVTAKLALIASVIIVGATLISPVIRPGGEPNDAALVAGGAWDVLALLLAASLAVAKPGRRRGSPKASAAAPGSAGLGGAVRSPGEH